MRGVFSLSSTGDWALISACGVLVFLLVISFRSRSTVFCQYLKAMTGISLAPRDVTREFKKGGQEQRLKWHHDFVVFHEVARYEQNLFRRHTRTGPELENRNAMVHDIQRRRSKQGSLSAR